MRSTVRTRPGAEPAGHRRGPVLGGAADGALGIQGARRSGRKVRTTVRDDGHQRVPDPAETGLYCVRAGPAAGRRLHVRGRLVRHRLRRVRRLEEYSRASSAGPPPPTSRPGWCLMPCRRRCGGATATDAGLARDWSITPTRDRANRLNSQAPRNEAAAEEAVAYCAYWADGGKAHLEIGSVNPCRGSAV